MINYLRRLEVETEQLKALLKREVSKFDTEITTKNNVISEYKTICSQLSEKLEKAQQQVKKETKKIEDKSAEKSSKNNEVDLADERIKEQLKSYLSDK